MADEIQKDEQGGKPLKTSKNNIRYYGAGFALVVFAFLLIVVCLSIFLATGSLEDSPVGIIIAFCACCMVVYQTHIRLKNRFDKRPYRVVLTGVVIFLIGISIHLFLTKSSSLSERQYIFDTTKARLKIEVDSVFVDDGSPTWIVWRMINTRPLKAINVKDHVAMRFTSGEVSDSEFFGDQRFTDTTETLVVDGNETKVVKSVLEPIPHPAYILFHYGQVTIHLTIWISYDTYTTNKQTGVYYMFDGENGWLLKKRWPKDE